MGNGATWADFRPPSSPTWMGCVPHPREAAGAPGSDSLAWPGRADSQQHASLSLQGGDSQGARFHLSLISFCAGNLMDSLTLRGEEPPGPAEIRHCHMLA